MANEIIDSEKSYLSDLILARSLYLLPLKAGVVRRITAKKTNLLFGNLEQLIDVNSVLYQKLVDRRKQWSTDGGEQCVGDIFVELAPMFVMYGEYCRGYGEGCELLKSLELKQDVSMFLQRVGEESAAELRSLGLHDLLIMPVQRLPRYLLLLRDLMKDTDSSHPDFENLRHAIDSIKTVTEQVNESIRLAERHQKLLELERRITVQKHKVPALIQPGRGLIREGKLGKITSRFARKGVRFFLLTDLLLYAYSIRSGNKKLPCKLHYKGSIPLGSAWLRDLRDGNGYTNVFQLVAPKKTYTLFADSPITKTTWMKEINQQILMLVAKDPSLRGKRGDVLVTSRTKNFQSTDQRFNRSPKSIRRVITTTDDLLAPPQLTVGSASLPVPHATATATPAAVSTQQQQQQLPQNNTNVGSLSSSLSLSSSASGNHSGESNAAVRVKNNNNNSTGTSPNILFEENLDQFLQMPGAKDEPAGPARTKNVFAALKKKKRTKGDSSKGTGLPLLELDDEGYERFADGDDESSSETTPCTEDAFIQAPTVPSLQATASSPKHRRTISQGSASASRPSPPVVGSGSPSVSAISPTRVIDPLSAAFAEPLNQRRSSGYAVKSKHPNEATHLRTSEHSREPSLSTPIQPVRPSDEGCHCEVCGIQ